VDTISCKHGNLARSCELCELTADHIAAIAAKEVLYNKYISQNTELHLLKREWMKVNGKDVFEIVKERDDAVAAKEEAERKIERAQTTTRTLYDILF